MDQNLIPRTGEYKPSKKEKKIKIKIYTIISPTLKLEIQGMDPFFLGTEEDTVKGHWWLQCTAQASRDVIY